MGSRNRIGPWLEAEVRQVVEFVGIEDFLGATPKQHAPTAVISGIPRINLEGDRSPHRSGEQFRTVGGSKHDRVPINPVGHREHDRLTGVDKGDPANGGGVQQRPAGVVIEYFEALMVADGIGASVHASSVRPWPTPRQGRWSRHRYGGRVSSDGARVAFEANPDAVLIVGADGVISEANPAAHLLFGYGPTELIGLAVEQLVPEMSRHRHVELRQGYEAHPLPRPMGIGMGLMCERADGTNVPVEISLSPLGDGGSTIATVRDVTDRLADRNEARRSVARLELLEDRERIARDLHDMVIQRLFASGMSLQAVAAIAEPPEVAERIMSTIDELDDTIRDIRNTIFELHLQRRPALSERVANLVADRRDALGFEPELSVTGEIDRLPTDVSDDLLATLAEALSNVGRHAAAETASVAVEHRSGSLSLVVVDDGRGMPAEPNPGHGLSNILWRAANHGGRCTWRPGDGGGTVMEWRVPVPTAGP